MTKATKTITRVIYALLTIIVSGIIGWILDVKFHFDVKPVYWILGGLAGVIAALLAKSE